MVGQDARHGNSLARELGQVWDRVPAYGSGKASLLLPVAELVELSAGYVEQGFGAVKVRVGMDPASDVGRVGAVRKALGDDVRIMCDANERLDLPTALWLGRRLADFDVYWFEEPVTSDDVEAHRRLARALPMPIVAGEHLCSSREFVPFVTAAALDVLQPNACMVGGITEVLRVGELAAAHGLGFAPHFMTELHVHVAASSISRSSTSSSRNRCTPRPGRWSCRTARDTASSSRSGCGRRTARRELLIVRVSQAPSRLRETSHVLLGYPVRFSHRDSWQLALSYHSVDRHLRHADQCRDLGHGQ
jgi:hypothetical protein